ncbi:hypothetical protein AQ490_21880 [Wenjunlia vitaminophila]|uniref:Uncharacterized protein n=1 Tax=Wenjunlia vitaminophila TaxID=76728 RepID=A0A0T6LS58_WENVI|nr:hypothetical protein [Wenjunlia vitaminophila]KRV48974.1 hypothetical protein AQ490_21880 [Wenjunlia vitaminophila]
MSRPLPGPRRRPGRLGVVALAGWLFADLLLVLALVSMADRPDPLADRPVAARKPTPSASPSRPPAGPRSVDRKWRRIRVGGTSETSLVRQIRSATRPWSGRSAALVQTFGGGSNGTGYAHRVNSLLHRARPDMFPRATVTDDFIDLSARPSTAVIRVYFYTLPAAPGGARKG